MADIAATDIAVTILNRRSLAGSTHSVNAKLVFGNGVLTYPAGGIPILKGQLGCPNVIESLVVYDSGTSGYKWSYDAANSKLVAVQAPAQTHTHDMKIIGSQAAAGTDAVSAKTLTLGKEAATNITIAGANSATLGGVASATLAAAALGQPSAIAIAAQTLRIEVLGW